MCQYVTKFHVEGLILFVQTNLQCTLYIVPNSEREDSFYPQILMELRHGSYTFVIIRSIYIRFSVMRASHAAACRTNLLTIAAFTKVGSRDCKRFPPLTTGLEAQNKVRMSQINIYRCCSCFRYTTNCLSNCWCKHFVHPHLNGQVASLFRTRPSITYPCLQLVWMQQN